MDLHSNYEPEPEDSMNRVIRYISSKTGLDLFQQDRSKIQKILSSRVKELKFLKIEKYRDFLEAGFPESTAELKKIMSQVVVGETYFFRDKGQFSLLRGWILPELMERKKFPRSLRLLSAGCSSGEEPYSLAMTIDEMIPLNEGWNVSIRGTDINEEAIEKARQGLYNAWSFRNVDPGLQSRYFNRKGTDWEIDHRIRNRVQFHTINLMEDFSLYRDLGMEDIDLILCRNVLMYLTPDAKKAVMENLLGVLGEGGYLITAHGELHGMTHPRLQAKIFPESIVYQREKEPAVQGFSKPPPKKDISIRHVRVPIPPKAREPVVPPPDQWMEEAERDFQNSHYESAIDRAKRVLLRHPDHLDAHSLLAKAYANLGDYDHADQSCRKVLSLDPLSVHPYCLLAQIAQEKGEEEMARDMFRKVIYLDPGNVWAHLELGNLYEREGTIHLAKKARTEALKILKSLPPETILEPYRDLPLSEIVRHVEEMVGP